MNQFSVQNNALNPQAKQIINQLEDKFNNKSIINAGMSHRDTDRGGRVKNIISQIEMNTSKMVDYKDDELFNIKESNQINEYNKSVTPVNISLNNDTSQINLSPNKTQLNNSFIPPSNKITFKSKNNNLNNNQNNQNQNLNITNNTFNNVTSFIDKDIKFKSLEIENAQLINEIKRHNAIEDQMCEMKLDMMELKSKFLELCEIVNELPCHELCKKTNNQTNRTKYSEDTFIQYNNLNQTNQNHDSVDINNINLNEQQKNTTQSEYLDSKYNSHDKQSNKFESLQKVSNSNSNPNNGQSPLDALTNSNGSHPTQIHKFSLVDKININEMYLSTMQCKSEHRRDLQPLMNTDVLQNLVTGVNGGSDEIEGVNGVNGNGVVEGKSKASIVIDGQLVVNNVVQQSIILKDKSKDIVHSNRRQSSLSDFWKAFIDQHGGNEGLPNFPSKSILSLFRATLEHNQIIERRNALQTWLNMCIVKDSFLKSFQNYLYKNDTENSHYVYWLGSSKIIEYNVKMESFRLQKIKNARLEVSRGSISMQNQNLQIIGGLLDSDTMDDIITFSNGQFEHSMFKLNVARYCHTSCTVGHSIYIIGGLDSKFRATASVELLIFNESQYVNNNGMQKCLLANPMHFGRHNFVHCINKNQIYVCGGESDQSKFSAEQYNIETNSWLLIPFNCNYHLINFGFIVIREDKFMILGGVDSQSSQLSKNIYTWDGKQMEMTGELKEKDDFNQNCVQTDENYIYLIGNCIHKQNKLKNSWSIVQYPENFKLSNYNKSMSCVSNVRIK